MYRVITIVCAGLALAGCSSTPDWMKPPEWMSLDALKPKPVLDTVRFESEPAGAEARLSNGQICRTPCALALPTEAPLSVTFTLNGYLPESDDLEPVTMSGSTPTLRPNPVVVELAPAAPPPKPVKMKAEPKKKPVAKKPATKKPAPAKPAANAPAPAPAPMQSAPEQQAAPSPWPAPAR
jgi:hypothetical protein